MDFNSARLRKIDEKRASIKKNKALWEGVQAHKDGVDRDDNPYGTGGVEFTLHAHWLMGWVREDRRLKQSP